MKVKKSEMKKNMKNKLVKICDEENRKFWFGISEVDRSQYEEDDPWWNIRIVYKNQWINYDENNESMTESELKAIAYEIENRFIKKENNTSRLFGFIEPDYKVKFEDDFDMISFTLKNLVNENKRKEKDELIVQLWNYKAIHLIVGVFEKIIRQLYYENVQMKKYVPKEKLTLENIFKA